LKTHPHLLLRDALAEQFTRAAAGEDTARRALAALANWARGGPPAPALLALCAEDGGRLFAPGGLAERFAGLDVWARDRARRFGAALAWIDEEGSRADTLGCARAAWDAGLFFEVHELLEPVWLETPAGERREALQGLIMAGAALHHLSEGNLAGARGLLRDAGRRLAAAALDELELAGFARGLRDLATGIDAGRIRGPADVRELPSLAATSGAHAGGKPPAG
jgi:hypothetical protein